MTGAVARVVAYSGQEIALILGGIAAVIGAIGGAFASVLVALRSSRQELRTGQQEILGRVENVHDELRTLNGLTVGALADQDETRRIANLSTDERTAAEKRHITAVPPKDKP